MPCAPIDEHAYQDEFYRSASAGKTLTRSGIASYDAGRIEEAKIYFTLAKATFSDEFTLDKRIASDWLNVTLYAIRNR